MPNDEMAQRDESSGLSGSRAEFAASLSRRIESVQGALAALEQQTASSGLRDNFLRRIHALGASARVLGFAAAAEILTHCEQRIRTAQPETLRDDILVVRHQLEDVPTLVLRGTYSLAPPRPANASTKSLVPLIAEPLAVVVWGGPELIQLLDSLAKSADALEVTTVTEQSSLRTSCAALGPDVLLLDASLGSITLLVDELAEAPEIRDLAIVVANVPDEAASHLLELGARLVLPSRLTEQQLARALLQVRHAPADRSTVQPPLGEVTLKDLAERLAQEIRQGLVDAAAPNALLERVALGEGTPVRAALWSALAQIREQVVERSEGRIQFNTGPEGSVPLAPRTTSSLPNRGALGVDDVDLSGRRILVADDDPAVAWFVGGTLRAAGAVVTEVHDGTQALALAYRMWPELVVSDVMMPGLDGFALCHALKRDVLLRDIPIILLSWKEDLLFRLRDLGADADGYLRKEANASTIVRRVRELLVPRNALELRLLGDRETRGRLDGTTTRLLLELTAALERPVRLALRDALALYDIRVRHGSLAAVTRTRHDGTVEHGESVLGPMLGITAGRFSVCSDLEPCEPMFSGSLQEILRPSVLRARAAQRVLSGLTLGTIDRLTLERDAFGSELPMLPISLRPIADELLRGTAPRQLLASGVASVQLLESLLSDVARRGAVRAVADADGQDLLEKEVLQLSATPSVVPPKPAAPPAQFTFQLTPVAPEVRPAEVPATPTATLPKSSANSAEAGAAERIKEGPVFSVPKEVALDSAAGLAPEALTPKPFVGLTSPMQHPADDAKPAMGPSRPLAALVTIPPQVVPTSRPPPTDDIDWSMELSWDSTPPPKPSATATTMASSATPASKAATAGGFMRPAIATLDRSSAQETPDLANVVVHAVSDSTPSPKWTAALVSQSRAIEPPTREGADGTKPPLQRREGGNLDPREPQNPQVPTESEAAIGPNMHAVSAGSEPAQQDDAAELSNVAHAPQSRVPFAESPSLLPAVHQPPRPKLEPVVPTLGQADRESLPPSDLEYEDPVFPLVSTASIAIDIQPSIDLAPAEAGETAAERALVPANSNENARGPMPAADHRTDTVDRSESDMASATSAPRIESSSADPGAVDPKFGTDAAESNTAAESETVQATNEAATHELAKSETAVTQRGPLPDRDTLRSPGGSAKDPKEPAISRASQPHTATTRSNSGLPSKSAAPSQTAVSSTSDPPASPVPPAKTALRPVGWFQALGLAALAGIVTFAVTVPIASWIHRRREPTITEPPIATAIGPLASAAAGNETTEVPASSVGTLPEGTSPSTSGTPASPRVEETAVPPDVALPPGQALLEVSTGGGHAIFVDDTFFGRGPTRFIPLKPGRHTVRTRLNGVERSDSVDLTEGRAVRISLEEAWK